MPPSGDLGVGLYECARLADWYGFDLRLVENAQGCVRFRLSGAPVAPAEEAATADQSA